MRRRVQRFGVPVSPARPRSTTCEFDKQICLPFGKARRGTGVRGARGGEVALSPDLRAAGGVGAA